MDSSAESGPPGGGSPINAVHSNSKGAVPSGGVDEAFAVLGGEGGTVEQALKVLGLKLLG